MTIARRGLIRRGGAALLAALLVLGPAAAQEFRLTILHTNDIHARFEPTTPTGGRCTDAARARGPCFGGYARIAAQIAATRALNLPLLVLDAGDVFQGSGFFTTYRAKGVAEMMNAVGYDAMALGNHEFDAGPGEAADLVAALGFPVIASNIDSISDPALSGRLPGWLLLERGGRKIGLIGLTTADTPMIASPGPYLIFEPEEKAAARAVAELRGMGAEIIIAISHAGLSRDRALARAVAGIAVIVGGHSHSLLETGNPRAEGPYPLIETAPDGAPVLIVQAHEHGRRLGHLEVAFDPAGKPVQWQGAAMELPLEMDADPALAARIADLAAPLEAEAAKPIGTLARPFDQPRRACLFGECELGNLVAEAILAQMKPQGVEIALQNAGGIRTGLPAGPVSAGAVRDVLPFDNVIARFGLRGADLRAALEHGVAQIDGGSNPGRFPQVAGLRFRYRPGAPVGARIESVEIQRADGVFRPLEADRVYLVAANDFLRRGGDGYSVLADRAIDPYDHGTPLHEAVIAFIAAGGADRVGRDGRIAVAP